MAFELTVETPHGIVLENAYANIDFISYTKRAGEVLFTVVFYKDEQARLEGLAPLPDMLISGNAPIEDFDTSGDIFAQVYEYIKGQADIAAPTIADAPESYSSIARGTEEDMQEMALLQYAIFKKAKDV